MVLGMRDIGPFSVQRSTVHLHSGVAMAEEYWVPGTAGFLFARDKPRAMAALARAPRVAPHAANRAKPDWGCFACFALDTRPAT